MRRAVRRDAVPAVALAAVLKTRVLGSLALAEVDAGLDGHAVPARLRDVERAGSGIVDATPDVLPAHRLGQVRVAEGGGSRAGNLGDGAVGDRDGGRRAGGDWVAAGQRGQDAVDLFVDLRGELAGLGLALLAEGEVCAGAIGRAIDAVGYGALEGRDIPAVDLDNHQY